MRLHEAIWPNKYILTMLGLWPMHPKTTLTRRIFANLRFLITLSSAICQLVPEIMTVAAHWGDIDVLGDFGTLVVIHALLTLKILYCKWRCRSFRSMYQHLRDFWLVSDDPRERRLYERPANLAKLLTIAYYAMGMSNLLSFEVVALIGWMKNRRETNDSLRHRPLLLELDYGFDTQKTPTYEIVYLCQSLCGIFSLNAIIGYDTIMVVFIVHVSAQFKLIAARFRAIGRKINDRTVAKEELRADIGKLIAQHQRAIRVAKELSALLSPVMFCQIMSSGLQICLGGYALIEGDSSAAEIMKFLVLFVTLLIQLIVFCAPAELLADESSAIAETIYHEVPWFGLTPSLRRDLGFVMTRAQKACHVTALYQVMSIRRITEVFNAAGSYMAMLKSMKK